KAFQIGIQNFGRHLVDTGRQSIEARRGFGRSGLLPRIMREGFKLPLQDFTVAGHGFLAFVAVKATLLRRRGTIFRTGCSQGIGRGPEPVTPLHDRDGVIRFPHGRKISSILIRNTVVPIATRTTLGSWLAIECVKSPKTRSCYEYHPPGRSKTVRTAVGRSIFPADGIGRTSKPAAGEGKPADRRARQGAKEKPTGLNRRARERGPEPVVIPRAAEPLDHLTSR